MTSTMDIKTWTDIFKNDKKDSEPYIFKMYNKDIKIVKGDQIISDNDINNVQSLVNNMAATTKEKVNSPGKSILTPYSSILNMTDLTTKITGLIDLLKTYFISKTFKSDIFAFKAATKTFNVLHNKQEFNYKNDPLAMVVAGFIIDKFIEILESLCGNDISQ